MGIEADFSSYTDDDWRGLADFAKQQTRRAGFYNDNYRLVHEGKALLFRFPKTGEKSMDPRPLYEGDVYRALEGRGLPIPSFLYHAPDKSFQVQRFVGGALIDEIYPPGQQISQGVIDRIVAFYGQMASLEIPPPENLAKDWPRRGPPLTFFEKLLESAWIIFRDHQETHGDVYKFLGISKDPFSSFLARGDLMTKRPWRLIHGDLDRANMIEQEDGSIVVIDWELAMYGDLLFCIAAHLHRARYNADEKEAVARAIYNVLPSEFQKNYMKDLTFYLDYEALKSVLIDTIWYPYLLKHQKVSSEMMDELSVFYADNLNRVSTFLSTKTTTPEQAMEWFESWADV